MRIGSIKPQLGFTLVELVAVMTLAGILSALAAVRMLDRALIDARGFADQVASTLQFAQKAAVAQRRPVYVNIDSGARRVRVCIDAAAACALPLAAPAGGLLDVVAASSVTLASGTAQFSFDGLGRPSIVAPLTLSATGGGSAFTVTVEPDTGYVRRS